MSWITINITIVKQPGHFSDLAHYNYQVLLLYFGLKLEASDVMGVQLNFG
jgi:hypothetical protein